MYWREVATEEELAEYVLFEVTAFPPEDCLLVGSYKKLIAEYGLRLFMLTKEKGIKQNRRKLVMGTFNAFVKDDKVYMGGFAVGLEVRGFRLSYKVMDKLLEEFGTKEIVCKTNPKDQIMQRVLTRGGFTNKLDKFEEGRIWSYWSRKP